MLVMISKCNVERFFVMLTPEKFSPRQVSIIYMYIRVKHKKDGCGLQWHVHTVKIDQLV